MLLTPQHLTFLRVTSFESREYLEQREHREPCPTHGNAGTQRGVDCFLFGIMHSAFGRIPQSRPLFATHAYAHLSVVAALLFYSFPAPRLVAMAGTSGYGAFQDLDLIMDHNLHRAFRTHAPASSYVNSAADAGEVVEAPVEDEAAIACKDEVAGIWIGRIGGVIFFSLF